MNTLKVLLSLALTAFIFACALFGIKEVIGWVGVKMPIWLAVLLYCVHFNFCALAALGLLDRLIKLLKIKPDRTDGYGFGKYQ